MDLGDEVEDLARIGVGLPERSDLDDRPGRVVRFLVREIDRLPHGLQALGGPPQQRDPGVPAAGLVAAGAVSSGASWTFYVALRWLGADEL